MARPILEAAVDPRGRARTFRRIGSMPLRLPSFMSIPRRHIDLIILGASGVVKALYHCSKELKAIAQRLAQGLQLQLEMSPVAYPGAVDWLAHLFGARRAHGAARLVKIETGRLEREPALIEEAPDMDLGVAHQILVLHMHDLSRQLRVPVIHQRQIAAVITPEVAKVVAESLSVGEVLLEGAEAAIHGMPACIDDGCVWQNR